MNRQNYKKKNKLKDMKKLSENESADYIIPYMSIEIPTEIKECPSPLTLKNKIKTWHLEDCPCSLRKMYIG